jgi:hypothetical protein
MQSEIHIKTPYYVLALAFTATTIILSIPTVMFEPTWEAVIRMVMLTVVLLMLCLSHPKLQNRRSETR